MRQNWSGILNTLNFVVFSDKIIRATMYFEFKYLVFLILDFDGVFVITTSLFSSLVKVKGSSTSPTELYLQSKIILNAVNKFVHIINNIYDVIQATIVYCIEDCISIHSH